MDRDKNNLKYKSQNFGHQAILKLLLQSKELLKAALYAGPWKFGS